VSWVAADNFHVTVKFLGAVDEARLPAVIDVLHAAVPRHARFTIDVGGLGAFPSATRARVLWAGVVAGDGALAALAATVDTALASLGFPREARAFSPHITVGRVREPGRAPALTTLLSASQTRSFGRVAVNEVTLMRSDLSPRGARYTPLVQVPLSDGRP
jgi:RNA 2',3'-cyclic 3'-phosphodiesterase